MSGESVAANKTNNDSFSTAFTPQQRKATNHLHLAVRSSHSSCHNLQNIKYSKNDDIPGLKSLYPISAQTLLSVLNGSRCSETRVPARFYQSANMNYELSDFCAIIYSELRDLGGYDVFFKRMSGCPLLLYAGAESGT
jgi:hypothetical protein